jgi:hypothetical protein
MTEEDIYKFASFLKEMEQIPSNMLSLLELKYCNINKFSTELKMI